MKKYHLLRSFAVLIVILGMLSICHFNTNSNKVVANCMIECANGKFIPHKAIVEVLNQYNVPISNRIYTDQEGKATFENILPGTYRVYCIWSDMNTNIYEGFTSIVVTSGNDIGVVMNMKN